jgi:hypothetical protein
MRHKSISFLLISTLFLFFSFSYADRPMSVQESNHYLPDLPSFTMSTITSQLIEIKPDDRSETDDVIIPLNEIEQLSLVRNKNPATVHQLTGSRVKELVKLVAKSKTIFENSSIDAQLIIQNQIQSVKIVGFELTPNSIVLNVKSFVPGREIKLQKGAGAVVIHTSCVVGHPVCLLNCNYKITIDPVCRNELGIL